MTHHHDHDHGHHPHGHSHTHDHDHGHHHHHAEISESDQVVADLSINDVDLNPGQLGRRNLLRTAGMLGAGAAAASLVDVTGTATAYAAERQRLNPGQSKAWLAGDHHIHTRYSSDGLYLVEDQVQHADAFGLDWMVITDHGGAQHAKIGVDRVNPEILASRRLHPDLLVFQGLEWNIPAAEHGTVFVHPGANEVAVLKDFENGYDGSVRGAKPDAAGEQLARDGVQYLSRAVADKRVEDALFLANHPARNGIDSPHEVRGWRDTDPRIAVGWEGAPGHQAAGLPRAYPGPGSARGAYGNSPNANSFPGFPLESYRTWGGFDFYTAAVGGLWDSLLAEGKNWSITANSDSHSNYLDTAVRGAGSNFARDGFYLAPEYAGKVNTTAGDYWPGFYSRTHVGVRADNYAEVMQGIRNGRVWVDHGGLLDGIDVQVTARGARGTLGDVVLGQRGTNAQLSVTITPARTPNWASFIPQLAKVDVIVGRVTGPVADRDTLTAPLTKVVKTWEVAERRDTFTLTLDLGPVEEQGFYVRLRGSDGKRTQAGVYGADKDPNGPALDVVGDADPWKDLWFYTNPVFVLPRA